MAHEEGEEALLNKLLWQKNPDFPRLRKLLKCKSLFWSSVFVIRHSPALQRERGEEPCQPRDRGCMSRGSLSPSRESRTRLILQRASSQGLSGFGKGPKSRPPRPLSTAQHTWTATADVRLDQSRDAPSAWGWGRCDPALAQGLLRATGPHAVRPRGSIFEEEWRGTQGWRGTLGPTGTHTPVSRPGVAQYPQTWDTESAPSGCPGEKMAHSPMCPAHPLGTSVPSPVATNRGFFSQALVLPFP